METTTDTVIRGHHVYKERIKWKERQERRLKLEAPKIESVHSPLHAQTGNDVTRVYYLSVITESNIIIAIYTADIAITALY